MSLLPPRAASPALFLLEKAAWIAIVAACAVGAAAVVGCSLVRRSLEAATRDACGLVQKHYYRANEASARAWAEGCFAMADRTISSKRLAVARLNDALSRLPSSHFSVYDPLENRRIWEHESVDTGLRTRMVEGALIVYEVLEGSPGEAAGVRPGDEIEAIDGAAAGSPAEAAGRSGDYLIVRSKADGELEQLSVPIEAVGLAEDQSPFVDPLSGGGVRLRISSFLPQYFEKTAWTDLATAVASARFAVVDVRGNAGGSFPAMLRAASVFFCKRETLGALVQAERGRRLTVAEMADDLDPEAQLGALEIADQVQLRAFDGYPCFQGPAIVLADQATSSTAEIFTEAFMQRRRSQAWGQPTSGQAVLARWFPLPALGGDYSLSIPIAGYEAASGRPIEAAGLEPKQLLFYRLADARKGVDSWLVDAAANARLIHRGDRH